MIKNIASDPGIFAGKRVIFEYYYTNVGAIDVYVTSDFSPEVEKILIEYKSGPGATICDYINDDGKERGNLVRELVSRDLRYLGETNRPLTSLQWRLEQPPTNFKELVRECLMSEIGRAELEKLRKETYLNRIIPEVENVQEFIDAITSNEIFNQIFRAYP